MSLFIKYLDDNNLSKFEDIKNSLININGLIIKENEDLYLLKYNRKEGTKEDYDTNEFLKECRSIILEKDTNKIICLSLKFKESYEIFQENVKWENNVIEESIDGTLINIYYYNNEWNISTRGTLDANCYWNSSKTFKDLFMEASQICNMNYELLDKDFSYSFVLCHPECRNIVKYSSPNITHILSRNMTTLIESDEEIGIQKPNIIKILNLNKIDPTNYDELAQNVNLLKFNNEGYMLYSKDRLYRTKLRSSDFIKLAKIKGNEPFINKRLLLIRNTDELTEFLTYFPEYTSNYKELEINFKKLVDELINIYTIVKIQKKFIDIPTLYRKPIYEIHRIYINLIDGYISGSRPTIRKSDIENWLENEPIDYQYYLYTLYVKYKTPIQ